MILDNVGEGRVIFFLNWKRGVILEKFGKRGVVS